MMTFLDECPKYIFFQLPKLNKYCFDVELVMRTSG